MEKIPTVKDIKLCKGMNIDNLVREMKKSGGFVAKKVAVAADIVEKMLRDKNCFTFLSFPACIIATGVRGVIVEMIKNKWVDAIVTTCGTLDHDLARRLEPNAPPPSRRLDALEKLSRAGIPVGVRLDPIIPFLNDGDIERLLKEVKNAGAIHVTSSTFKPRLDGWRRMEQAFSEACKRLRPLYFEQGERIGRSYYLPRALRFRLMKRVYEECRRLGLSFACCREGFPELNTAGSCDGSHLIPAAPNRESRGLPP